MVKQRIQSIIQRQILDRISSRQRFSAEITLQQIALRNQYQSGINPPLADIGFSIFSEFDEDGLLHYVFSVIGTTSRLCIEIGCGDCAENNTTNLIMHHGWNAILIDISEDDIQRARQMFLTNRVTKLHPPELLCKKVDEQNVNSLLASTGLPLDNVDLLSLDIDSKDLWVLKALEIRPRVIVLEINARWPEGSAMTVARAATDAPQSHPDYGMIYGGASLTAFCRVMTAKDYRLIGGNRVGTNALFMRNDTGTDQFPAVPESQVLGCPRARAIQKKCAGALAKYPWAIYEES